MVRKPTPGSDAGEWGQILNDFLDVSHTADGRLREGIVGESTLAPDVQGKLNGPSTPTTHSHAQSDVTGLAAALAGKADSTHSHTGLDSGAAASGQVLTADGAGGTTWGSGMRSNRYAAFEKLRTLRAFGTGRVRVAVISDSTGNGWVRPWSRKFGALLPASVRRTYKGWNYDTAWGATTVDAAGTSSLFNDTFTRTGAIVGSVSDSGATWVGAGTAWVGTGTQAQLTTGASGDQSFSADLGGQNTATVVTNIKAGPVASHRLQIRIRATTTGDLGSCVALRFTAGTDGKLFAVLRKVINGVTTEFPNPVQVNGWVTTETNPQQVSTTLTLNGTTLTGSVVCAGQTTNLTATLDAGDVAMLGPRLTIYSNPTERDSSAFAFTVDSVTASVGDENVFDVWNGSVGGSQPSAFDATRRGNMFGSTPFDVVVFNFSHNGALTPTAFISAIETLVTGWMSEHPESSPIFMSQNPRKSPAPDIAGHTARLAALRTWTATKGYPYIPVWETYRERADGGASLVQPDGIHQTNPPGSELTGDYGSLVWADVVMMAAVGS